VFQPKGSSIRILFIEPPVCSESQALKYTVPYGAPYLT